MRHRVLKIGRWVVDFLFATVRYDTEGVLACLYELGATDDIVNRTEEMMESDEPNTGFTYTNPGIYRALVVVGPTSSGDEFIDTFTHEIHHLAVAIASNLGIDLEGETPAYLAGDSARDLADLVCELGCSKCHRL